MSANKDGEGEGLRRRVDDAELARRSDSAPAEPPCGVCLGRPLTEITCICGGSGLQGDEVIGLRRALYDATEINDAARAFVNAFDRLRKALE